jgi:F-box protein 31
MILKGTKITGDPNVPAGSVSFKADLNKPVSPSLDEQGFLPALSAVTVNEDLLKLEPHQLPRQAFVPPRFTEKDIPDFEFPLTCKARFIAECQIAKFNFSFPR